MHSYKKKWLEKSVLRPSPHGRRQKRNLRWRRSEAKKRTRRAIKRKKKSRLSRGSERIAAASAGGKREWGRGCFFLAIFFVRSAGREKEVGRYERRVEKDSLAIVRPKLEQDGGQSCEEEKTKCPLDAKRDENLGEKRREMRARHIVFESFMTSLGRG